MVESPSPWTISIVNGDIDKSIEELVPLEIEISTNMDNIKGKNGARPLVPKIANPSSLPSSSGVPSSSGRNLNMPMESPVSPTAEEMAIIVNRSKKAASYLRLLTHCKYCQGSCQEKECIETFRLMKHVALCGNEAHCLVQGCQTTKRLLQHAAECSARHKASTGTDGPSNACLVCTLAASSELGFPYSPPSVSSKVSPRTSTASMTEQEGNKEDEDDELPIKTHIPSFCYPRSVSPTPAAHDNSPSSAMKRRLSGSLSSDNIVANTVHSASSSSQHAQSNGLNEAIQNVTIAPPPEQPVIKTPRLEENSNTTVFSLNLESNSGVNVSFGGNESDTRRGIPVNP